MQGCTLFNAVIKRIINNKIKTQRRAVHLKLCLFNAEIKRINSKN